MPTGVILPKFSMTMEEGTIVRWLKDEGAAVQKGDPICEVMTEKVNMEVEAPASGVLGGIRAKPGDVVPATRVIAYILQPGEAAPPGDTSSSAAPPTATLPAEPVPASGAAAGTAAPARQAVVATPVARRLAQEAGLDLSTVSGTGPTGRITEGDVRAALAARTAAGATTTPTAKVAPAGTPLNPRRRIIGQRMLESAQTIPHIYLTRTVDMSAPAARRGKASYTAVAVWAVARALGSHPRMRASLRDGLLTIHDTIDIGVAVDTPDGLIVPVVHGADRKELTALHQELEALVGRTRDGRLALEEVEGAVFTLSNLGMFGVDAFTALINPPQSAILAVGAVRQRAWVADGALSFRPACDLTLAVDHRVADGADGARFLADVAARLEHMQDADQKDAAR